MRNLPLLKLAVVVAVLVAACGSSDSNSTTTSAAPRVDAPPEVSTTSEPGSGGEDRSAELIGRWEVTDYQLPDGGGLTNVVGEEPVFLEFDGDGTLAYHTGCNLGGATYETTGTYYVPSSALDDRPEGQPIAIGPVFEQEQEGCDGFLGDQDRDLPIDLGRVTRFVIDGDSLRLLDEFLLIETTRSG